MLFKVELSQFKMHQYSKTFCQKSAKVCQKKCFYALFLLSRRFSDLYKRPGDVFGIWETSRYFKSISIQRMDIHCSIHNQNSQNGYHCNMDIVTELLVRPGPCGSSGRYSLSPAIVRTWWYTGSCYLMSLSNLLPNEC